MTRRKKTSKPREEERTEKKTKISKTRFGFIEHTPELKNKLASVGYRFQDIRVFHYKKKKEEEASLCVCVYRD